MNNYEIPACVADITGPYELLWSLPGFTGESLSTTFTLESLPSGFCVHVMAAFSRLPFFRQRPPKGRVFEDDCLELFIRPQLSRESFFPASFYYGWEINAGGVLLDYRAGIGEEGRRIIGSGNGTSVADGSGAEPGVEPVHGLLHDDILGTLISFDYDWKSRASIDSRFDAGTGRWSLDLSVPWADFGLAETPRGETWYFTVNRIDAGAATTGGNPGLACLHEGISEPRFHQPDLFPSIHIL